jgi:hypothetical protein
MTIAVECKVEKTKSDKWVRLAPVEGTKAPIGPVQVRATELNGSGSGRVKVTISR